MANPTDFVALSLMPIRLRRDIAGELRAGIPPHDILERLSIGRGEPIRVPRERASELLQRATKAGMQAIFWGEADYPSLLAEIVDPPPVLWVNGQRDILGRPSVAVVGSRAASPYALSVAERLAGDLASRGLVVVSGLARGVDSAAHRGALHAAGVTVAVLGSGIDVIYPQEHATLARHIAESGAIVSEVGPGAPPQPYLFPLRNRIISGLSRAVIVVEAGEKSGSLITARSALDQGRDVMAVPGNVLNDRNRGGHALLRDGARLVESAEDVLDELGMADRSGESNGTGHASNEVDGTGEDGQGDALLACLLPGESCDLDEIASRTGLPPARLLPRLLELELRGGIRRLGGGRFVRFDRSC